MLVRTKNGQHTEGYFSLAPNIKYRVLAIAADLTNEVGSQALIVRSEDIYPQIACIKMDLLEIIDDTPEADWVGGVLTHDYAGEPIAIVGYPELISDKRMFVRIHDLNDEEKDLEILFGYYDKYGPNEIDTDFDPDEEARFHHAEESIVNYRSQGPSSKNDGDRTYIREHASDYFDGLEVAVSYLMNKITKLDNERERTLLAIKIQRLCSLLEALSRVDQIPSPANLADIAIDSAGYPNYKVILDKVMKREYVIQKS